MLRFSFRECVSLAALLFLVFVARSTLANTAINTPPPVSSSSGRVEAVFLGGVPTGFSASPEFLTASADDFANFANGYGMTDAAMAEILGIGGSMGCVASAPCASYSGTMSTPNTNPMSTVLMMLLGLGGGGGGGGGGGLS